MVSAREHVHIACGSAGCHAVAVVVVNGTPLCYRDAKRVAFVAFRKECVARLESGHSLRRIATKVGTTTAHLRRVLNGDGKAWARKRISPEVAR